MEKQKRICNVLEKICLVAVILMLLLWMTGFNRPIISNDVALYGMYFFLILGIVFNTRKEYLIEKDNPVSLKRTMNAIVYVAEIQEGTKDELVEKFCLQMYDKLIASGIIHQIKDERVSEEKWEVTTYGLTKASRL